MEHLPQRDCAYPEYAVFRSEECEFTFLPSPTTIVVSNSRIRRTLGKKEVAYREKIKLLLLHFSLVVICKSQLHYINNSKSERIMEKAD